jgi:HK97 family phage major capsid protein
MPQLTEEQVQQLAGGLEQATKDLNGTRAEMAKHNERVGKLLEDQERLKQDAAGNGNRLQEIGSELQTIAGRLDTLAEQHTNLIHTTRQHMKALGSDGASERGGPFVHNGVIFDSKQQALEVGMYFMATMRKENAARANARRWLRDHKQGLRWLPQIPDSFVKMMGDEWLQSMQQLERGITVQDLTGGATPGSVLVRPEFSDMLIRNVEEYGVFRQEATIWPMGSDTVYIPRRSAGLSVYWEGEAEAGTETDPTFQLLGMTAKKMMSLHQHSSELSEDAAIPLAALLVQEFALAVATEEDRIGFNGNGNGGNSPGFAGYIGVLGAPRNGDTDLSCQVATGAAGANLSSEITEAKLREMTGLLHTWARANAKWFVHRTVHADLDGIQMGTSGGSVVKYQDNGSARIMGYPVRDTEACPAASDVAASEPALALGDLRRSWILGDRRQMEVETSEHYAFNTDQLTVRMKRRCGFLMKQGNGMVVYVTGTA